MGYYTKSAAVALVGGIAVYFGFSFPNNFGKSKMSIDDDIKVDDPPVGTTLIKVAFVFRHGDRTPLFELPGNSVSVNQEWLDGKGELTKMGKKNAYLLGKRLRKRYDAILTPYYSKTNLHVVSTSVERTMMSALLVLAGMYPPTGHQEWSETIPWIPIPVYHNAVFNRTNCFGCPRFRYEVQKVRAKADQSKYISLMNVARKGGYTFKNPKNPLGELMGLFDLWSLQKRTGLPCPDWADEYIQHAGETMNEMFYSVTAKTEVQRQLSSSLMSNYLLWFLGDERKVSLFSAHDLTLFILSGSLGFGIMRTPSPTACVAVEVHEKNAKSYVKAFYITESTGPMVPIEMGCGVECEMSEFVEMIKKVIPDDYQTLCHDVPDDVDLQVDRNLDFFLHSLANAGVS